MPHSPTEQPAGLRIIDADRLVTLLPPTVSVGALLAALHDGLDPERGVPRSVVPVTHGQLLLMPAEGDRYAGVKLVTLAPDNPEHGLPRIQGQYLLLAATTLTPIALLDGAALTLLRTAAVSAAAARLLATANTHRMVLFGTGPQAESHLAALSEVLPLAEVTVVGRTPQRGQEFLDRHRDAATGPRLRVGTAEDVAAAELVVCCTTSRQPVFDGSLLRPDATVLAMGAHEPDACEVDDLTITRGTVVAESRGAARREAGAVIEGLRHGVLADDDLWTLADLAAGATPPPDRPRVFISVGMPWEDLVVAAAAYDADLLTS